MHYKTKAKIVGWLVRLTVYAFVAWSVYYGMQRHR